MLVGSDVSAMWAFRTYLHSFVSALRTAREGSLRPHQDIDHKTDNAGDHDEDHPQHRIVHPAVLGVFGDPDKEGDVERDECNDEKTEEAKTAASCCTAGGVIVSLNVAEES